MPANLYDSAQEWLQAKVQKLQASKNVDELASLVTSILDLLDGDQIQDVFQSEMADDGFFYNLYTSPMNEADPIGHEWTTRACLDFLNCRLSIANPVVQFGRQVDAAGWQKVVQEQIDQHED